jgi:CspA family cold shock protein
MDRKEPPRLEHTQRDEEITPDVFEVSGSVKWFDPSKGYGFIVPDENLPDVLLHVTCLRHGGYQTLYEGARMVCEVVGSPRGLQAVRICSMDDSTAIHPSQLPQRTHVVVVPESDWERAVVKWFNRPRGFGFLNRGSQTPDIFGIWKHFGAAASPSSGLAKPCSCATAGDQRVSLRWNLNPTLRVHRLIDVHHALVAMR